MSKWRSSASGRVIIGGQAFDTDAPIVNFTEGPKWDARIETCIVTETDPNPFAPTKDHNGCEFKDGLHAIAYQADNGRKFTIRHGTRPGLRSGPKSWNGGLTAPYDAAKQVIKQFMIHHDGCASADMCFSVIQNERGLSCHFLVDNDGTIFQTLDLALEGWHGSELNANSIGVELCSRGDIRTPADLDYYSKRGMKRDRRPCEVNNHKINSWDFTEEQKDSMRRLGRALLRLLPNLPAEYPQESPGQQLRKTMPRPQVMNFNGYIGHYHLTETKWDPGPWDFKDFIQRIRGAFCFPMFPRPPEKQQIQPAVPATTSAVRDDAKLLYAMNEQAADGGFFPVGPWGESRIWHGGVHLAPQKAGGKVFAPFPGRLVAARMGASSPIGSMNFVLLRHQMALAERRLEFYSLYMHLADEQAGSKEPLEWLANAKLDKDKKPRVLKPGEVWLLDEPIEAGQVLGTVGTVGPGDLSRPQVHVEMFSISELFEGMANTQWTLVDGTSSGRFCEAQEILGLIDTNKDTKLSREELRQFFSSSGESMHYFVTRHVSTWTAEPNWAETLKLVPDFRIYKPEVIDQWVTEQIAPGLWWDDRVAQHARLPQDGVVHHYHPITFVSFVNQRLADAEEKADKTVIDVKDTKAIPPGITDDRDGIGMANKDAAVEDDCNAKITMKELLLGYDAPECK